MTPSSTPARTLRSVLATVAAVVLLPLLAGCRDGASAEIPEAVIESNILGTAYLGQQDWSEAEVAFRGALDRDGDSPLLLTNVAIAMIQQGEIEPAVEVLEQALQLDPTYPYAHYNLGLIDNQNGEFEAAAAHFEAVASFDPEDLFTQYYLGSTLSRIDRQEEAVRAYRKALERNPTHVSSLYGLGRLLLQQGDQDEGRRLITLSQEIRSRSGLDVAVGGQYGEQGPYAMGIDYPGDALAAPAAIPVSFVSAASGTTASPQGAWTLSSDDAGQVRFLTADGGTVRQLSVDGLSEPLCPTAPGDESILSLAAGDLDNDGVAELVALLGSDRDLEPRLLRGEGSSFAWAPSGAFAGKAGLGAAADSVDLALVDRDHDGDLDLFWCWTGKDGFAGCKLGTNDGAAQFEVTDASAHGFGLPETGTGAVSVAFSDVDNDRDIDLLVGGPFGIRLLSNQRDGSFEDISDRAGLGASTGAASMRIVDLNKDGWMDLLFGTPDEVRLRLNVRGRFADAEPLTEGRAFDSAVVSTVIDIDNDGFLDLARSWDGAVRFGRNLGQGRWEDLGSLTRAPGDSGVAAPLAAFDADRDGDLDLVARTGNRLALLTNEGGNANRWIDLASAGMSDNKFGIGTKVEILSGALRQKFEVTRPVPLHAGVGQRQVVQSARYLWPSGVLQDEVQLKTNGPSEITQLDRKGTSCPLLYAWGGDGWRFVTDFLGGCAVGYQLAPGVFSVPDTDEYVRIDGGLVEDEDGRLPLRLNNQLEEVIWFDKVELVAVDHPTGTEVYPNERLMPGPPFPEFRLFASGDLRPVASARGVEDGADLTEILGQADRRYADNFTLLRPKGYADLHTLELDLGALPSDRRVVLLLDGWIDYADSSANVAAAQAGLVLVPPRLLVADGRGGWFEPEHRMGFPAGLPKTMAVDVSGLFRSADHRVRIRTNMRVYWDRVRIMVGGERTRLEVRRLEPLSAELRFGGFPDEASSDGKRPFGYDPAAVEPTTPWKSHVGAYTPFGDVTELVTAIDDRFVTTRAGDQMLLRFRSPGAPAPGWSRTYLLYADGFGKDMDPNSAASNEVGPIPFHGMPVYPYGPDVKPPVDAEGAATSTRRVLASERGWPGAVPQPLIGRGGASAP